MCARAGNQLEEEGPRGGKTRSSLTGSEVPGEAASRREERSVPVRKRDKSGKKERKEGKEKKEHAPPPAGLDETHACDPIPMAFHSCP